MMLSPAGEKRLSLTVVVAGCRCDLRGLRPCRNPFLVHENLDPPIHTPTARSAVVGDRFARAVGNHANLRRVEALVADQIAGDAGSALLSELVVVGLMANAVGIPGDHEYALRISWPRDSLSLQICQE